MGWVDEAGLHEGYVVPEFADGQRGTAVTGGGVPADQVIIDIAHAASGEPDVHLTRPAAEAIGWRVMCDCRDQAGNLMPTEKRWMSELLVRVPSKALEDVPSGRIYATDNDVAYVSEIHDEAICGLWRSQHADEKDALASISATRDQLANLEQQLTTAVAHARAQGASWEAIGRAAGMSRQSAHERWGRG